MSQKLGQLFKNIAQLEPTSGLKEAVFQRIEREESGSMRRKLVWSWIGLAGSALATVYAILFFGSVFMNSEFVSMLSLAFSDLTVIARNWNDYAFSLVETFPTLTAVAILLPLFILFLSLSSYLELNSRNQHKYVI